MIRGDYSYRTDPAVPSFADDRPVVLFDGDCALCSSSARTLLRHGPRFRLLAAQSALGRALLTHYDLSPDDPATMLLIEQGRAWGRSQAVIRIARGLPFPWRFAVLLAIIPRALRDRVYDGVAARRRSIRGETWCALPPSGVDMTDRILG